MADDYFSYFSPTSVLLRSNAHARALVSAQEHAHQRFVKATTHEARVGAATRAFATLFAEAPDLFTVVGLTPGRAAEAFVAFVEAVEGGRG